MDQIKSLDRLLKNLNFDSEDVKSILYISKRIPKIENISIKYLTKKEENIILTKESIVEDLKKNSINLPTLNKYNTFLDIFSEKFRDIKDVISKKRKLNIFNDNYESNKEELDLIKSTLDNLSKFYLYNTKIDALNIAKKIYKLKSEKKTKSTSELIQKNVQKFREIISSLNELRDKNLYLELKNLDEDIEELNYLLNKFNSSFTVSNNKKGIYLFLAVIVLMTILGVSIWAFQK